MTDQQILTQSASLSNVTANLIQSNNNNNNNINTNNQQQINSNQAVATSSSSSSSNTRKPCNCTKSMCLKL